MVPKCDVLGTPTDQFAERGSCSVVIIRLANKERKNVNFIWWDRSVKSYLVELDFVLHPK